MPHTFRILHVSDLHERGTREKEAWRRRRVLGDHWLQNLAEIREQGPIDLVCFTGDLADWGKQEEYEFAEKFLEEMMHQIGIGSELLYLVPGNHDIDRNPGTPTETAWKTLRNRIESANVQDVSRWLHGGKAPLGFDDNLLSETLSRQNAYRAFLKKIGRDELLPENSPHGKLGYHAIVPQRKNIKRLPFDIHIIGLDSSWLCGDDSDTGRLRLTSDQVMTLCTDDKGVSLDGFRLVLMHHPLSDLADGSECRRLLAPNIDLLLRGHMHETEPELSVSPGSSIRQIATGCLYEGHRADQWPNSCTVISVNCDDKGRPQHIDLRFRSFSSRGGHWYDDASLYAQAPKGILRIDFEDKPLPRTASKDAKPKNEQGDSCYQGSLPESAICMGTARHQEKKYLSVACIKVAAASSIDVDARHLLDELIRAYTTPLRTKELIATYGFSAHNQDDLVHDRLMMLCQRAAFDCYIAITHLEPNEESEKQQGFVSKLIHDRVVERSQAISDIYVRTESERKIVAAQVAAIIDTENCNNATLLTPRVTSLKSSITFIIADEMARLVLDVFVSAKEKTLLPPRIERNYLAVQSKLRLIINATTNPYDYLSRGGILDLLKTNRSTPV